MFKILLILSALGGLSAFAEGEIPVPRPHLEDIIFNAGFHTEFYNALQSNQTGSKRKFDPAPTLGLGFNFPLEYGVRFLPEVNWVLPHSSNTRIIKNLVMYRLDFGYNFVDWFRLRVGTSIMWLNQHGRGGSTTTKNGNETSTFYYPDENHSSLNNTFDVGFEFIRGNWAARAQTYTYSIFKEERRQLSYTLMFSYYWNQL